MSSKLQHDEIALYTDGSCKGNSQVASNSCPAGWGVFVVENNGSEAVAELFGPVVVDSASSFFLGAEHGSSSTGELSAMCEALLWLRDQDKSTRPAAIFYDSVYAAKMTMGKWKAKANHDLVAKARTLLDEVRQKRSVRFEHVKGHSNDKLNDAADALANRGSSSETCTIGRYTKSRDDDLKRPALALLHFSTINANHSSGAAQMVENRRMLSSERHEPKLSSRLQKDEIGLYTGGSCKRNCPAGWGVVVVENNGSEAVAEVFGPVVVDSASSFFLGAEHGSSNTGELSAMCEALLWLRDQDKSTRPVAIFYDSVYAAKMTMGEWKAKANHALVTKARTLLDEVRQKRSVRFEHVKDHSNDKLNDAADALANRGSTSDTWTMGYYVSRARPRLVDA